MNVVVDIQNLKLTDSKGLEHRLFDHEFWYLSPNKTEYDPIEGPVSPYSFGMVLHNARCGEGIHPAMEDLLSGIDVTVKKRNGAGEAERLIEEARIKINPKPPSRLRCFYLNYDKEAALKRMNEWPRFDQRDLVRCYSILSSAFYHYADVRIFEELANDPSKVHLADEYWLPFKPKNTDELYYLEVLINGALYFPDWQTFPTLDENELVKWQSFHKR